MDAVVEDADLFLDIDALASFSGGPAISDLFSPSPEAVAMVAAEAGSPVSVNSRSSPEATELLEIERFLMEDAGVAAGAGELEGVSVEEFLDSLFDGGEGEEKGKESEARASTDGNSGKEEEEVAEEVEVEVDGDDPISKKKRRQMRNRDSAMKSRERKKMYIKDLEMKSKYLEAECRRLSYTLQCCAAENVALRQSFLKDRPIGAPTAMQQSAVLMGTLPLVSLLWLVSIVCLFLMPGLPNRSPVAPSSLGRDMVRVAVKTSSEPETWELILHGRRCLSTRARIKLPKLSLLHAVTAC